MAAADARTGDIRSEEHGPHWVAWVAGADGKPVGSVILVGETQAEAESRAREWARGIEQNKTAAAPM